MTPHRTLLVFAITAAAHIGGAQTARELVASGDSAHAAFDKDRALAAYERAVQLDPQLYDGLWKASRGAVDAGEFLADKNRRKALFTLGISYARRAVAVNPRDPEGHFALGRALGMAALSVGVRDRVKYAVEIREQALAALAIDSTHAGALHVMGSWNAEVMRLNGLERLIAKSFLGGAVMGTANWSDATKYMERAVATEPSRLVHHLDLARIYVDTDQRAKARAEYQAVITGRRTDVNDVEHQREAEQELAKMRGTSR
jgi:tetratricopeptide (TPR) repeat protein